MQKTADKIFSDVNDNFTYLKDYLGNGIGLIVSEHEIFKNRLRIGLIYIESITDKEIVRKHILTPLLQFSDSLYIQPNHALSLIKCCVISATDIQTTDEMDTVIEKVLDGYTVLFIEKANRVLLIPSYKAEKRAIETPENESTVLGSQESFTDDLATNTSQIIRRLRTPSLHFEEYVVGTLSRTKIKLGWLEGIADPKVIEEARRRIQKINVNNVDGIGILSELIEDKPWSLFPKYKQTERPDVAARGLTGGRFCILCNNSPFAFVAPISFWDNFKTMDDYEERFLTGSYLRLVRYIAFFITVTVSALYLAFVTYNHAIVPPSLALSMAQGREGVPFPTVIELLLLTFSITIIREAGLRMTGSVGYFIGTLAAVLIGQAIVTAGYVSPSLIIVVVISTISSFAISATTLLYPSRLMNYFLIVLAGFFGIFGVINGLIMIYWHLASLSSFGVPYLYPVVPFNKQGIKDVFIRFPEKLLKKGMKGLKKK